MALCLSVLVSGSVFADYPLIHETAVSRDPLYRQQQQDVELWYAEDLPQSRLMIYRYVPRESETLFSVATAFNLPYDSIATLNGWDSPGLLNPGKEVLIPNIPGLFIRENPEGNWGKRLSDSMRISNPVSIRVDLFHSGLSALFFFPGEQFTSAERIRFLESLFSRPLNEAKITSTFGYRHNPFTGGISFHPGVDLRAPTGTSVLSARDGIVKETGTLEIYGKFIIIDHDGGYQSVYAHLNRILVSKGQTVNAGNRIALSGNSGISTGPHLHFEIRRNGKSVNPARLTSFYE